MPDNTDVTAVVVTHNSARHLAALGQSLSAGSLAPTRMLAVDNLSSDDTVSEARAAGFEVLETGTNDGFGAGCNAGLRGARTGFVLFCNPDVRPSGTALQQLLTALAHTPTAAIAAAALDGCDRARRFSRISTNVAGFLPARVRNRLRRFRTNSGRVDRDTADGEVDRSATTHSARDPDQSVLRPDHIVVNYAEGAFFLCRVAPLRSIGGFDEDFFLYFEEEDLSRRLGAHGWQTLLVRSSAVLHGQRASSEGFDNQAMAPFFTNSLYLYYRKYHSRAYAELARCVIAACVLLDRGSRTLAGRPQLYGPGAATAPFRSSESVRRGAGRARWRR